MSRSKKFLKYINRHIYNYLLNTNTKLRHYKDFLLKIIKYDKIKLFFLENFIISSHFNYKLKCITFKLYVKFLSNIKILNNFTFVNNYKEEKNYFFKTYIIFEQLIKIYNVINKNFLIIIDKLHKNYIYDLLEINDKKINKIIRTKYNKNKHTYFTPIYASTQKINIILNKYQDYNYTCERLQCYNCRKNNKSLIYNKNNLFEKNLNSVVSENHNQNIITFINTFNFNTKYSIFGQNENIDIISKKLIRLDNNKYNKPIANFLLCGPSGTGKTDICKILSTYLGSEKQNLIKLDMSELAEEHSVSRLLGSPPGYVGGGKSKKSKTLVDEIIDKPNSVVLLDEIEKAYKRLCYIFLQILDEGILIDSSGTVGNFTNSFVVFTSNLGIRSSNKNSLSEHEYKQDVINSITDYFPPEFINRLDNILIFNYLDINSLYNISHKFVKSCYNNVITKKRFNYIVSLLSSSSFGGSRLLLNNFDKMLSNSKGQEKLFVDYKNQLLKCVIL
ncbi:AAA domain (Cdc48 subfamily) family protein (apicoplast) [Theileria parva strain Muguga]|uniref:ClpC molecular chaperone, putative n=1 Tax=Theileria parva TaxID=5875 RepID=Q4MYA0_THEPA|nr:AAA domain (Cdc48 subfamily) family protein [Theileria parva strain Muguga]|eukprot:XP_762692.1 molecular chaperone (apicoplast) [Theileria parva strain Muguga]